MYFSQKFESMIKSMTGFGKAECELPNKKITIEVKSLNSKQLDINSRFPGIYKEKDLVVRKLISEKLIRGKVEFNLYSEQLGEETNAVVNKPIIKKYFEQLSEIGDTLNLPITEASLQAILRLPDSVKITHEELDEADWNAIQTKIMAALDQLDEFRVQEGKALEEDMVCQVEMIKSLQTEIEPYVNERIEKVRTRITDALSELEQKGQADPNRFEQELIFYLEKLDINEEQVRLTNHCEYFIQTMKEGGAIGKKLNFISQEIGREINTLGSKANHTEIQKLVIKMKDSLERIKEQALNIL